MVPVRTRPGMRPLQALAVLAALAVTMGCPAPDSERRDRPRTDEPADTAAARPGTPAPAPALPAVAITVDDLPWVGPLPPGMTRLQATDSVLAALAAHDVRATGFVNCDRVQAGAPVLRRWLDAGHQLGNHTSGHLDLNEAPPATWAADARSCDAFLRELTGEDRLPFRYPYLRRGHTAERYRAGREVIHAMDGVIAPVTIETLDWIMDAAYVAALRAGDRRRADAIVDAYADHVISASRHYRRVAEERVGRDVAHIALLHANALLAHHLGDLLDRLAREGFDFIPLETALDDPVYALDDDYRGREGISWLYRIAPAVPEAAEWDWAQARRLRALTR